MHKSRRETRDHNCHFPQHSFFTSRFFSISIPLNDVSTYPTNLGQLPTLSLGIGCITIHVRISRIASSRLRRSQIRRSRVEPTNLSGLRDSTDPKYVRGKTHVDSSVLVNFEDFLECRLHHTLQPIVYILGLPEEVLLILHPLKIRDRYTAGVAQDIRDQEDALFIEDLVGLRCDWPVGSFRNDLGFHLVRIFFGDRIGSHDAHTGSELSYFQVIGAFLARNELLSGQTNLKRSIMIRWDWRAA